MIAGIFVGGAAARMGGLAKGLLRAPDGQTIVGRWRAMLGARTTEVVLVGEHAAYRDLGLPIVPDAPSGIGPLGGLVALLAHAQARGAEHALALGCDMPFVSPGLLDRLIAAPTAPIVAPRRQGRWEIFFARHVPRDVLPLARAAAAEDRRSLQRLFERAGARELVISAAEGAELRDWDAPEDVEGD